MRFLAASRSDRALGDRIGALDPDAGIEAALEIAAEFGFTMDVDDLREAYARDWAFRRMRYLGKRSADSAASAVAVVKTPPSGI